MGGDFFTGRDRSAPVTPSFTVFRARRAPAGRPAQAQNARAPRSPCENRVALVGSDVLTETSPRLGPAYGLLNCTVTSCTAGAFAPLAEVICTMYCTYLDDPVSAPAVPSALNGVHVPSSGVGVLPVR